MSDSKKNELTEDEMRKAVGGAGAAASASFKEKSLAGDDQPELIVEPPVGDERDQQGDVQSPLQ